MPLLARVAASLPALSCPPNVVVTSATWLDTLKRSLDPGLHKLLLVLLHRRAAACDRASNI